MRLNPVLFSFTVDLFVACAPTQIGGRPMLPLEGDKVNVKPSRSRTSRSWSSLTPTTSLKWRPSNLPRLDSVPRAARASVGFVTGPGFRRG